MVTLLLNWSEVMEERKGNGATNPFCPCLLNVFVVLDELGLVGTICTAPAGVGPSFLSIRSWLPVLVRKRLSLLLEKAPGRNTILFL